MALTAIFITILCPTSTSAHPKYEGTPEFKAMIR